MMLILLLLYAVCSVFAAVSLFLWSSTFFFDNKNVKSSWTKMKRMKTYLPRVLTHNITNNHNDDGDDDGDNIIVENKKVLLDLLLSFVSAHCCSLPSRPCFFSSSKFRVKFVFFTREDLEMPYCCCCCFLFFCMDLENLVSSSCLHSLHLSRSLSFFPLSHHFFSHIETSV